MLEKKKWLPKDIDYRTNKKSTKHLNRNMQKNKK